MFDLNVLAYQTDLTRVSTFLMGREKSGRTYAEIGVPDPHHPISHHQNRPEMLEREAKINAFHMQLFAHFLQKLRFDPEGDGTLLDHSLIVHGAGMSNSDIHLHHDLPMLLAGGGAGQVKGGRHLKFVGGHAAGEPVADAHRQDGPAGREVRRQQGPASTAVGVCRERFTNQVGSDYRMVRAPYHRLFAPG